MLEPHKFDPLDFLFFEKHGTQPSLIPLTEGLGSRAREYLNFGYLR